MTRPHLISAVGLGLFAVALVRTAWVADDAFITLRSVDNVLNGYGPVWNVGERVQVFTHPLWFALCTLAVAVSGNAYYSVVVLNAILSVGTLWVFAGRIASGPANLAVCFAALLSSKAFIDFSTSGLENPLTNLMLAVFVWQWWDAPDDDRRLGRLASLGMLCALTRLDLVLLVGPAIASRPRVFRHAAPFVSSSSRRSP